MSEIRLRTIEKDADSEDSRLIWSWRNDPHTRQMSLSSEPITWHEHRLWYEQAWRNPKRLVWIIELKGAEGWVRCGVVRLDKEGDQSAYIGLNIDPHWRHQGIGRASLEKIGALAPSLQLKTIDALIKAPNHASIHLFTSLGFVLVEDPTLQEEAVKRYRWTLED